MIILTKLVLAHLIGDFVLQPKSWVMDKERRKLKSPKLYLHVFLHGALILLFLWDFGSWPIALILTLCHLIVDALKLYQQKSAQATWFLMDQALHLLSIVGLYWLWFQPEWNITGILADTSFWLVATAIIFVTVVSGIIIQNLIQRWSAELDPEQEKSLKNAGKYIGILERSFVFLFVLIGRWEAVGFLLAAKSIFRFGDLNKGKERKLTEYILIGTLFSFGIAVVTGLMLKYLLA